MYINQDKELLNRGTIIAPKMSMEEFIGLCHKAYKAYEEDDSITLEK